MSIYSVITGTGSCVPKHVKKNSDFSKNTFLKADGTILGQPIEMILSKFKEITGIEERRYADSSQNASDLGDRKSVV